MSLVGVALSLSKILIRYCDLTKRNKEMNGVTSPVATAAARHPRRSPASSPPPPARTHLTIPISKFTTSSSPLVAAARGHGLPPLPHRCHPPPPANPGPQRRRHRRHGRRCGRGRSCSSGQLDPHGQVRRLASPTPSPSLGLPLPDPASFTVEDRLGEQWARLRRAFPEAAEGEEEEVGWTPRWSTACSLPPAWARTRAAHPGCT